MQTPLKILFQTMTIKMMFVYTLCFVCFVELYVLRSCDVFCELHTLDAY